MGIAQPAVKAARSAGVRSRQQDHPRNASIAAITRAAFKENRKARPMRSPAKAASPRRRAARARGRTKAAATMHSVAGTSGRIWYATRTYSLIDRSRATASQGADRDVDPDAAMRKVRTAMAANGRRVRSRSSTSVDADCSVHGSRTPSAVPHQRMVVLEEVGERALPHAHQPAGVHVLDLVREDRVPHGQCRRGRGGEGYEQPGGEDQEPRSHPALSVRRADGTPSKSRRRAPPGPAPGAPSPGRWPGENEVGQPSSGRNRLSSRRAFASRSNCSATTRRPAAPRRSRRSASESSVSRAAASAAASSGPTSRPVTPS